jgi:hypothetical protein
VASFDEQVAWAQWSYKPLLYQADDDLAEVAQSSG